VGPKRDQSYYGVIVSLLERLVREGGDVSMFRTRMEVLYISAPEKAPKSKFGWVDSMITHFFCAGLDQRKRAQRRRDHTTKNFRRKDIIPKRPLARPEEKTPWIQKKGVTSKRGGKKQRGIREFYRTPHTRSGH